MIFPCLFTDLINKHIFHKIKRNVGLFLIFSSIQVV